MATCIYTHACRIANFIYVTVRSHMYVCMYVYLHDITELFKYILASSPIEEASITLTDGGNMIVSWTPLTRFAVRIHQYIVKIINSSGTFYYNLLENQHQIVLPYFRDTLVFVSAVSQFGQSDYVLAKSNGMFSRMYALYNQYLINMHMYSRLQNKISICNIILCHIRTTMYIIMMEVQ